MIFETHTPDGPIAPFIESLIHFKHFVPDHSIERIVPTGHIYILFELDGQVRNTFDAEDLKPDAEFTRVWISGMHRNYISISAHEDSEMFVLQFKPFGSYPFTHIPCEELNGKIQTIEGELGTELLELREAMLITETSAEKFELMEKWLLQRFDEAKAPPPELVEFMQRLQQQPVANLNQLIESYPATQKNLIDQFKKYVGLTPNTISAYCALTIFYNASIRKKMYAGPILLMIVVTPINRTSLKNLNIFLVLIPANLFLWISIRRIRTFFL